MGMAPFANAQITLFTDDFETNYNDAVSIDAIDDTWYTFGTDFTFPATNSESQGAEGSDWYVKLQRNGTVNFAYIERVFELIAGETYEFKAWVFPDLAGQRNAYSLRILDNTTLIAQSANPTQGNTWEEISLTYVAEANQAYKFRFQKTWGNAGGSMDNYSVVCTTCTTASVEDLNSLNFTVSPNPASGIVRLISDSPLEKVELYSLTGAKIIEIKGNDHIDLSGMSSGIYLLKAYSKNRSFVTKKLIKN